MKAYAITAVSLLFVTNNPLDAFQPLSPVVTPFTQRTSESHLHGLFDPFHGGGSAKKKDLDEIWEAQQAILRARRGETEPLKKKYASKPESPSSPPAPKEASPKVEATPKETPKFFWEK